MNWSRGFLRAWIVVSVCWVLAIGAALVSSMYEKGLPIGFPFEALPPLPSHEQEMRWVSNWMWWESLFGSVLLFVTVGMLPPAGLLLAGYVGRWIARGFKN